MVMVLRVSSSWLSMRSTFASLQPLFFRPSCRIFFRYLQTTTISTTSRKYSTSTPLLCSITVPPSIASIGNHPDDYTTDALDNGANTCYAVNPSSRSASIPAEHPSLTPEQAHAHGYALYRKMGSPRFVVAPMVNQSELPFRMLTRKYAADLCYTPMLHAKIFSESAQYRKLNFSTCAEDRPLIAQFCANDPRMLLAAARYVENDVDAVDINCGCPQTIARRGNYGAYLLSQPDLIVSMVSTLYQHLRVPVTVKMRILSATDASPTIALALHLQAAGAAILCVHGRTKEENKLAVGPCNFDIIRQVKAALTIPVFANGGVSSLQDCEDVLRKTGCDGVMTSEGILGNPALFSGHDQPDYISLAHEYLDMCETFGCGEFRDYITDHLFKLLHHIFPAHPHVRQMLVADFTSSNERRKDRKSTPLWLAQLRSVLCFLEDALNASANAELNGHIANFPKWYYRHDASRAYTLSGKVKWALDREIGLSRTRQLPQRQQGDYDGEGALL